MQFGCLCPRTPISYFLEHFLEYFVIKTNITYPLKVNSLAIFSIFHADAASPFLCMIKIFRRGKGGGWGGG